MTTNCIYLMDDDEDMLEILGEVVTQADLQPQCFNDATQLFDQMPQFEEGSVLVLDLNMPHMDGVEVMRRLAKYQSAPALFLISGSDGGILRAAAKLGLEQQLVIIGAMQKPLDLVIFQQVLMQFLNGTDVTVSPHPTAAKATSILPEDIQQAIHQNQFVIHYQPQIEIATGRLAGVEALIRWQHPQLGLIYPNRFIGLAEAHQLIDQLTQWVIHHAIEVAGQWKATGLLLSMALNISASNVNVLDLPEEISGLVLDHQLDPTAVSLEVTEGALMGELVTSLDILTRLRLKGIGLSIDDFGTGYSSLSQLHRIPFTELKIDLSFVSAMSTDAEARAIVKTCIMLGHELEMRVVAEGVEDRRTLELLRELDCDVAQGYFIAKPIEQDELPRWAANWQGWA